MFASSPEPNRTLRAEVIAQPFRRAKRVPENMSGSKRARNAKRRGE
jgi:hypothetical protein